MNAALACPQKSHECDLNLTDLWITSLKKKAYVPFYQELNNVRKN